MKLSLRQRHDALVPQGTMVSSKARTRFCDGYGPEFIAKGDGAYVWDDQGRKFLTYDGGLGALCLGHNKAVSGRPQAYPLPHVNELKLAELIQSWIPWLEQFRFMKTGSNVTNAAVRLARTFTGKDVIVSFGDYHGCSDEFIDDSKEGVPPALRRLTGRMQRTDADLSYLVGARAPGEEVAAVILEPASLKHYDIDFLKALRQRCNEKNMVLIFDEVITGFRAAPGGIAELSGVQPDLWCAGKAMGNGWPISVIAGKREIMQCFSRTHLSGTHYAEPTAMAAAITTLKEMKKKKFWYHQGEIGSALLQGIRMAIGDDEKIRVVGHPWHMVVQCDDDREWTLLQLECLKRGFLYSGGFFVSLSHTMAHVRTTLSVFRHAIGVVRDARSANDFNERLKGVHMNQQIFKRNS